MKKTLIYIIVAAVLIGLAAWKIADNKKKQETEVKEVAKQVDKINVNVITASRENIDTDYSANGTFIPKQETKQSSEISGRIVNVLVREGSRVGAGQVLATIKRDAIEVDVTQAQNTLQNAIIDNQRYENAFKTGGVTKQQLDNSRLQLKNAQSALRAQGVRVNDTSVRAGISGTINKKRVEPGMVVAPGTALFEIVNINTLKLSVLVDESQVGRIQIGQTVKINVNVITASRENIDTDYSANGTFIPKQESKQSSEISGRIVNVLVKEGSRVGAGQVLATIKRDAIEVDVSQAQNNLQNAIADNQRYENAYKTGGVTKQQLDNSRLQLKNAQAALRAQGVRVNDTSVRAGISGTINKKMVEPGMVVAPGTALFEIVNINTLKLSVLVDESQVGRIQIGQTVKINVNVLPEESFSGRITFIAPKSDASLNFPVEIEVQNRGNLKAGMYATAVFKTNHGAETQNMLTVPAEAFVNGVSSGQLFVVNNGTAKLIKVTTGKVYGDKVQILSGLNGGEQVITSGQINLDNGSKINIVK